MTAEHVVFLRAGCRSRLARVGDIVTIDVSKNDMTVKLSDDQEVTVRGSLARCLQKLPAEMFFQVGRSRGESVAGGEGGCGEQADFAADEGRAGNRDVEEAEFGLREAVRAMSDEVLMKISGVPVYWDGEVIEYTGEMTSCPDGSPGAMDRRAVVLNPWIILGMQGMRITGGEW